MSASPNDARERSALDPRLVRWMAVQALRDCAARLVDGGAGADRRIDLAALFIDLPVATSGQERPSWAVPTLLQGKLPQRRRGPPDAPRDDCRRPFRCLLVGGPGSGKSTVTTMVAQQLRASWISRRTDELPEPLRDDWARVQADLSALASENTWPGDVHLYPIRVNLPDLARWLAACNGTPGPSLWDYLAVRMAEELAGHGLPGEMTAAEIRGGITSAAPIFWIFDGLDEVPPTAGRRGVVEFLRATVGADAEPDHRLLVSTRPQGYQGEFDDLDPLELVPLDQDLALRFGDRLLSAWLGPSATLDQRRARMNIQFKTQAVRDLLHSPLHCTIATILLASSGDLPRARVLLFEYYFDTIFRRELGKDFEHGIQENEKNLILALHVRAGLVLHVRAQAQTDVRATLRRRELRDILAAIYAELGYQQRGIPAAVERITRFAADRLVLLLHSVEGAYEFGIRSLQEYFAALALMRGKPEVVLERLARVVLDSHWTNVLAFVVSSSALETEEDRQEQARERTVALCAALNAGELGGPAAARCFMGSRLAMWMLRETATYGHPWLHEPLWQLAFAAASAPLQSWIAALTRDQSGRRTAWNEDSELHSSLGRLVAGWTREDAAERRQQLLTAAAPLLTTAGPSQSLGWRLLQGCLQREVPEAVEMAAANAPRSCTDAHSMYRALMEGRGRHFAWMSAFIGKNPQWFTPSSLETLFAINASRVSLAESIRYCIQDAHNLIGIRWPKGGQWAAILRPLADSSKDWAKFDASISAHVGIPEWALWQQILRFLTAPAAESLADVLDAAGEDATFAELDKMSWYWPWPIHACILHARTPAACKALAAEVRAGSYGTAAAWQAAESRWDTSSRLDLAELAAWLTADGPWNVDIDIRGSVVPSWADAEDPEADEIFTWLTTWITDHADPPRKAFILLEQLAVESRAVPLAVARRISSIELSPTWLLPDLTGADAEGWYDLLDALGRTSKLFEATEDTDDERLECLTGVASALVGRLAARPDQWGLLDALICLLPSLPDTDLSALRIPDAADDAPPLFHALRAFFLLLTDRIEATETATIVQQLRGAGEPTGNVLVEVLATVLRLRAVEHSGAITILEAILDARPAYPEDVRDAALGALFAVLRRSVTASFADAEAWRQYALPRPYLPALPPVSRPPWIARIDELRNIRLFRETPVVDVPFPLPPPGQGQWLVLVGENGSGKTTLLRALGLAIAAPAIASKLLDERLPMVRNGEEARIALTLDTGPLAVVVRRDDRTEVIEADTTDGPRPWIVGYGVRRGNARGEKDREAEIGAMGELHTLYDRPASLHNASQWLRDLEADVLREQMRSGTTTPGPRGRIWRSAVRALQVLLRVTSVEVDDGGTVCVTHPDFGRVRLDALSDGYLTTAGWVIDMIARWVDRQHELDEPIGPDLLRQMCGMVLIDEIDLHLHPMWQMRIVEDVRRLFPRLSFVVTTHNPLTLQGVRRGEIYVMRRDGARTELVQCDIRPGQDVDRVLFEQFGVRHTFDRDTRELLAQHRSLLEGGADASDPERVRIEGVLRERLGEAGVATGQASYRGPLRAEDRPLLTEFLRRRGARP